MRSEHTYKIVVKVNGITQDVIVNAINPDHAKSITQYQYYPHTEIKVISVILLV